MKKIINLISILLLLTNWTLAQEDNCSRIAYFGKAEICLPKINGYQECYSDSIIKQIADGTEVPSNMILGFYLDSTTFEKKDSIGLFSIDNYFKVYGTKQLIGYKANSELLKQLQDILEGNFFKKNWELMEKEIDKIGLEVEIGVPTVIKSYNLNKNSFTYIMLARYKTEGIEPYTLAITINGLLINESLIWMAYCLKYNGEETIARLQEKSNTILTELLNSEK